jgi:arginine exporter protein ArgO
MSRTDSTDIAKRSPVRTAALAVGVLFLIVGALGFIPGITTDYDELEFAGHDSEAELLGLFQVSVLHNLVHLAFGVLGVLMATTSPLARLYLIAGGAVYLVLWLYGLIVDDDEDFNFVPLNDADDWLHLCLGVGMIALGLLLPRDRSRR